MIIPTGLLRLVLGVLAFLAWPLAIGADTLSLKSELEAIRARYKLPSLAVVSIRDGTPGEVIVTGVRKQGESTKVTPHDKFHIGSCTKSMTATLIGMLVDEGKLKWESTIADRNGA